MLSIAALAGLSIGSVPFTVDLPNHAARLFIECHQTDPVLSRMYRVDYGLIPNLAIDLLNQPFCGIFDPLAVVRGIVVLAQAGVLVAVWKIHRFLNGQPNAFVLLAPALTFSVVTSVGYANYLVGTLLFLAFAFAALRYRLLERRPWIGIALANLAGTLLFFCHIFALALAVIFVFGLSFGASHNSPLVHRFAKSAVLTLAWFATPLVMVFFAEPSSAVITYDELRKLRSLFAPFLFSSPRLAAGLACVWAITICLAIQQRAVFVARTMRWPLGLLLVYAMMLPSELADAVDLDSRSLSSIVYLTIAALALGSNRLTGITQSAAALLSVATVSLQLWLALPMVRHYEGDATELRGALAVLEPGATIISIENMERSPPIPKIVYRHLASFATIDRKAFNPLEFTGKGMQPLVATSSFACIDAPVAAPLSISAASRLSQPDSSSLLRQSNFRRYRFGYLWNERFNYVLYYHFGAADNPFPGLIRPVRSGSFFTIFRTNRPVQETGPCTETARLG